MVMVLPESISWFEAVRKLNTVLIIIIIIIRMNVIATL